MRRTLHWTALATTLLVAGGVAACQGCHNSPFSDGGRSPVPGAAAASKPTVRLYVASTIAGALEPCGCSKDQLGGVSHLAAYVAAQAAAAPRSLFVGAGPMLFLDPKLRSGDATQDEWKADAIASAFKALHLAAWAPGANDWAAGADRLAKYRADAGALLLAGNIVPHDGGEAPMPPGLASTLVREVGGVKVGVVGVSDPKDRAGGYPEG